MAAIVNSIEISRRPEDVFAYLTNPSHLPDWQESAVSVRGEAPLVAGWARPTSMTRPRRGSPRSAQRRAACTSTSTAAAAVHTLRLDGSAAWRSP